MKIKYLVLVSLILAILTIGAASASYDADTLAVDDNAGDAISQDDNTDVAGQDGEEPGDDPADERSEVNREFEDYDRNVRVDEEEASIDIQVFSYDGEGNEQTVTGNITLKIINDDETETVLHSEEIAPYSYDDGPKGGNSILIKDLKLNPGKYNLALSYDGDENYRPFVHNFMLNYYFMAVNVDEEVYNHFTLYFCEPISL